MSIEQISKSLDAIEAKMASMSEKPTTNSNHSEKYLLILKPHSTASVLNSVNSLTDCSQLSRKEFQVLLTLKMMNRGVLRLLRPMHLQTSSAVAHKRLVLKSKIRSLVQTLTSLLTVSLVLYLVHSRCSPLKA
jgi:hypothetical protein